MCKINEIEDLLDKYELYVSIHSYEINMEICKIYQNQIMNIINELEAEQYNTTIYRIRLKNIIP